MEPTLFETIPDDLRAELGARPVVCASFGAGPGCCAGKHQRFDPPVTLEVALDWLERYRGSMRSGHIAFADQTGAWFHRSGFDRYDATPKEEPRAGLVVRW